ncbi:hypothetical protein CERSUDRAFT_108727 [Gelatoporia subvermispora B]|uniref:PUM-HD domain-containing protein n=1 Tax=Ceriporiopsis subvermispora (strain B) TaxID=914234 RepID=M2PAQ8_CERS8|nr:hypothetical protein CERSUDRAFT_108727 [Gelatoporia subvermispora B]
MQTSTASQSFVPLFDSTSSRHPSTSSIWAPQPQPSDTTWSKAIDTFTLVNNDGIDPRPEARRTVSIPLGGDAQGIFGPTGLNRKKDVGAIGDGRKKNSPTFDPTHVEQLFRTLNLNSPVPYTHSSSFMNDVCPSPTSPDLSPTSTTSALLTPTDLSPAKMFEPKFQPVYDFGSVYAGNSNSLLFETGPSAYDPFSISHNLSYKGTPPLPPQVDPRSFQLFEPFSDTPTHEHGIQPFRPASPPSVHHRVESAPLPPLSWDQPRLRTSSEWMKTETCRRNMDYTSAGLTNDLRSVSAGYTRSQPQEQTHSHEPINFLSLLHPSSTPPYHLFVARIIKSSDQQASIFLQQKLKVADTQERAKIVDAICTKGFEMMAHRFGNWAVQRCLEATASIEERRKIVACMRGRVVDLATNCYGCHVLQKALDCEEDIRLAIVSELLLGDPAQTLVNKHASHVWSKIMELTWTPPAPPIFAYVNKSLKGKWASLACHETGSLVVQHAFENLEEAAKDGIVDELLNHGTAVFGEVAKNQWGSYCIQHILEHGSQKHKDMALEHLLAGLLEYSTSEQGVKSVTKALKEGGKEIVVKIIKRMCEPAKGGRRAMIVDLALSVTGSQLIASVLPTADKDERALLYDSIRGHIVTLRGCKTGSKVIWLFDRMRAYYGY